MTQSKTDKWKCHNNPNKIINLKLGQKYWTFYKHPTSNFVQVLEATFNNDLVDRKRILAGHVYENQNQAKEAANK